MAESSYCRGLGLIEDRFHVVERSCLGLHGVSVAEISGFGVARGCVSTLTLWDVEASLEPVVIEVHATSPPSHQHGRDTLRKTNMESDKGLSKRGSHL